MVLVFWVKLLILLTWVDQECVWGLTLQVELGALEQTWDSTPILRWPISRRPFQLHTYWSILGIGVVLIQRDDNGEKHVLAYVSWRINDAKAKYSCYKGKCFVVVVWAVTHFRAYIYGENFAVVTNHQPLKWLIEYDKLTQKLARWDLLLLKYDF